MNIYTLLLLLSLFSCSFEQTNHTDSGCRDKWMRLGSRCYLVETSPLPYRKASQRCKEHGAILAEPIDREENQRLRLSIIKFHCGKGNWLGLKKGHDKTVYFLSNNESSTYSALSRFQFGSDEGEDCIAMSCMGWQHFKCSDKKGFACQMEDVTSKTTTTISVTTITTSTTTTNTNTTTTTASPTTASVGLGLTLSVIDDETDQMKGKTKSPPHVKRYGSRGHRPCFRIWSVVLSQIFIILFKN